MKKKKNAIVAVNCTGALSGRGGNSSRCAKNPSVNTPTRPATRWASSALNNKPPMTIPSNPNGNRKRSSSRSQSLRKAAIPSTSITNNTGIRMAAACATVTASAIIGTANAPNPVPKPLLLTPSSSTAGAAST